MTDKVLVSWSGGKDCAYALDTYLGGHHPEVLALLTTVTEGYDRISMHGVRRALVQSQAAALGLPLDEILIPQQCSNEQYEQLMGSAMGKYANLGVTGVVFGDLFLEDVRKYREEKLAALGMKAIFPIWGIPTHELAPALIDRGFKAVVACVDTAAIDGEFVGREFDERFLADLPAGADPCGENGEFHTFVYDGPPFSNAIAFRRGEKILRERRFYYCDLVPPDPGEVDAAEGA